MGSSRDEIARELRHAITSGAYKPGTKLPSYRQLADMFGAVPNTAGAAVRLLADEGLVSLMPKSAAVVRTPENRGRTPEVRLSEATNQLQAMREEVRSLQRQLRELEERVSAALATLGG
jgi:DNA-binding GntR family transcriptional regulator